MKELLRETTAYKILCGDRAQKKLSHAYMLHFTDGKNLREALKFFSLAFFGAEEGSSLYKRILSESYTDFKVYPKDGKKLDAAAVAEILEDSAMRPVEGDKKLYVIAAFDAASPLLQNKLLKTLEEPLSGIHFILGATSLAPVLDTVRSRVKLLEIPPFTEEQIFAALERKGKNDMNAAAARSCNGILGVAENMLSGGWFKEIATAAQEICSATKLWQIGELAVKYGETKYKNELLSEMQRLYFNALSGDGSLSLERGALVYALENLSGAFADVKFNAFFQGLLYDFMLRVVKENDKWQKLRQ